VVSRDLRREPSLASRLVLRDVDVATVRIRDADVDGGAVGGFVGHQHEDVRTELLVDAPRALLLRAAAKMDGRWDGTI
jgi:hypothetical protein